MSEYLKRVIVDDEEYIIQTMSAEQQWELFQTMCSYGLEDALFHMANQNGHLVGAAFFGRFMKEAPNSVVTKATQMLLGYCTKAGSDTAISIKDFSQKNLTFVKLHIEALKLNYPDFYEHLQVVAQVPEPTTESDDELTEI